MANQLQVTAIGQCVPIDIGTKAGRGVSITLQAETEKLVLMLPEAVASVLAEKLQGLNLPPSNRSPLTKLS